MTDGNSRTRAIGLLSGGLDSSLAIKVIQEQGIEVIGLNCIHPFHSAPPEGEEPHPIKVAKELGIEIVRPDVTEKMLEMLKDPPHGFGKHLNPCMDCRIMYLEEGRKLMEERDAKFLLTGEVLGQRPMSQRRDAMNAIDRDSGLRGLILRPLCAKLLDPTIPEKEGWVDREKLLSVSGRGRKDQLELAERYGLKEHSSPAGGCLLTMEDFARKMADLMAWKPDFKKKDVEILKAGRYFKIGDDARLVVGKNDGDNRRILALAEKEDALITTDGVPGPAGLLTGGWGEAELQTALAITGRYVSKAKGDVPFVVNTGGEEKKIVKTPMPRSRVKTYAV